MNYDDDKSKQYFGLHQERRHDRLNQEKLHNLAEAAARARDEAEIEVLHSAHEVVEQSRGKGNSIILNTVVRWIVFVILIFAFYLFWNGHNAPGGGFIAGLMTAAVVVFLYVSYGSPFLKISMRFDSKYLLGIGLSISLLCGMGAMVFGYPFLTHTFGEFHIPLLGELELATATIFDLGVYMVVTGGCITIITAIGESGYENKDDESDKRAEEVAENTSPQTSIER